MRAHRRFWIVVSLLVAAVLAFDAAYLAFGHAFVTRAFERGTRGTLRAIIPSWASFSLADYLAAADRLALVYSLIALALIAMLIPGAYAQGAIGRVYDRLTRACDAALKRPWITVSVLAAATFGLLAWIATGVLLRFPNSGDEYCYLLQARLWLDGRAWYAEHPLQPFFDFLHIRVLDGRVFSVFPPGWPVVIFAAAVAGVPAWLVNPILGALTVPVFFAVARRWYEPRVVLTAIVAMLLSAFFLLNSASYYAHTFTLLVTLVFAAAALGGSDRNSFMLGLLAGASFGAAFAARFFTAIMCGLPFGVYHLRRNLRHWRFVLGFAAGVAPILAAFLWHNQALMGRWGVLPMSGFEEYTSRWFPPTLLTRGTDLAALKLWEWIIWTPPAVLPLYAIAMAYRTGPPRQRLLGSVFLCLVAGYYFYVDDSGNRYGPRYYFEALPFVMLPAAWLAMKEASWRDKTNRARWYFYLFALSLALAIPIGAWQTWIAGTITYGRSDLYRVVEESRVSQAIVFVATRTGTRWAMNAHDHTRNWGRYDGSVLFALDRGDDNVRLMDAYPGRACYRYTYDPVTSRGRLEKLR
jgi:hypothetical protein